MRISPGLRRTTLALTVVALVVIYVPLLLVVVGWAATRGTSPAGLFDAVVTFRVQAEH